MIAIYRHDLDEHAQDLRPARANSHIRLQPISFGKMSEKEKIVRIVSPPPPHQAVPQVAMIITLPRIHPSQSA